MRDNVQSIPLSTSKKRKILEVVDPSPSSKKSLKKKAKANRASSSVDIKSQPVPLSSTRQFIRSRTPIPASREVKPQTSHQSQCRPQNAAPAPSIQVATPTQSPIAASSSKKRAYTSDSDEDRTPPPGLGLRRSISGRLIVPSAKSSATAASVRPKHPNRTPNVTPKNSQKKQRSAESVTPGEIIELFSSSEEEQNKGQNGCKASLAPVFDIIDLCSDEEVTIRPSPIRMHTESSNHITVLSSDEDEPLLQRISPFSNNILFTRQASNSKKLHTNMGSPQTPDRHYDDADSETQDVVRQLCCGDGSPSTEVPPTIKSDDNIPKYPTHETSPLFLPASDDEGKDAEMQTTLSYTIVAGKNNSSNGPLVFPLVEKLAPSQVFHSLQNQGQQLPKPSVALSPLADVNNETIQENANSQITEFPPESLSGRGANLPSIRKEDDTSITGHRPFNEAPLAFEGSEQSKPSIYPLAAHQLQSTSTPASEVARSLVQDLGEGGDQDAETQNSTSRILHGTDGKDPYPVEPMAPNLNLLPLPDVKDKSHAVQDHQTSQVLNAEKSSQFPEKIRPSNRTISYLSDLPTLPTPRLHTPRFFAQSFILPTKRTIMAEKSNVGQSNFTDTPQPQASSSPSYPDMDTLESRPAHYRGIEEATEFIMEGVALEQEPANTIYQTQENVQPGLKDLIRSASPAIFDPGILTTIMDMSTPPPLEKDEDDYLLDHCFRYPDDAEMLG